MHHESFMRLEQLLPVLDLIVQASFKRPELYLSAAPMPSGGWRRPRATFHAFAYLTDVHAEPPATSSGVTRSHRLTLGAGSPPQIILARNKTAKAPLSIRTAPSEPRTVLKMFKSSLRHCFDRTECLSLNSRNL